MVKGCRSFAGMVHFLSMFCPDLQKLLKPIYDLTRKGRPFIWGKEQQDSFEEITCRLIKLPVLHMPNKTGRFHLYSNISKFAAGSVMYGSAVGFIGLSRGIVFLDHMDGPYIFSILLAFSGIFWTMLIHRGSVSHLIQPSKIKYF